ncbi:hypothetical protein HZS_4836 [Henneguya salminicola]|nr:hypothetical protein HZS_4836 [Henneguya salminicola]
MILGGEFKFPHINTLKIIAICHTKSNICKFLDASLFGDFPLFKNAGSFLDLTACPYTGFFAASDIDGFVYVANLNERFLKTRAAYLAETTAYCIKYADQEGQCTDAETKDCSEIADNYKKLLDRGFEFHDCNEFEQGVSNLNVKLNKPKEKKGGSESYYYETLSLLNLCSVNRVALNSTPGSLCWLASGGNAGLVRIQCISSWTENMASESFNKI